jgi:tRNA 5-methylaminomethyl-2-thiouridine biosynthesis bifunctional protein
MVYDVIIIGAGIAGSSSAYFLNRAGLKVLVLEKNTICSGGSNAAGAFISPKISKPSPYKDYLNQAFLFSTNFYKQNFPNLFNQCGLIKIPLDQKDIQKCKTYEPFMQTKWEYREKDKTYYFPEAGFIPPFEICKALLKNIKLKEQYEVKSITHKTNWHIDNFEAKNIILATGSDTPLINLPYIKTKNIAGYRYDTRFKNMEKLQCNKHKNLSISAYYKNKVMIGATHILNTYSLEEDAIKDSENLIEKAKKIMPIEDLEVLKQYIGYRNATFDYFPIVGEAIDHEATLTKYPYIKKGSKVPNKNFIIYPNLYIHLALASRGFVFAPYNAKLLTDLIINQKPINDKLSPIRLFKKWARKA